LAALGENVQPLPLQTATFATNHRDKVHTNEFSFFSRIPLLMMTRICQECFSNDATFPVYGKVNEHIVRIRESTNPRFH
jgi:hypothetical protein